jgi:outer membrane protein assembly factor BamB
VRRKLTLLLVISAALLVLTAGCVRAASPRGWAAPAQFQNLVLITTHTGKLDAIDPATGDRVWRFPDDWSIVDKSKKATKLKGIYGAPQVLGDTVYVGDYNGFVYAFKPAEASTDKNSKKEAAYIDVGGPVIGGITLDPGSRLLYVTTGEGRMFALRAEGFQVVFSFDAGDRIWTSPVVSGGNVYFATTSGMLFALNATTGAQVWEPFSAGAALVGTPVAAGNVILVGGFGHTLYAVDGSTGQLKWQFEATDWIWTEPFVQGDRVYFGDFGGKVFALSVSNGELVWQQPFDAGHTVRSGPVMSNGALIIGTENGAITGLDPATGDVSWGPVQVGNTLQSNLLAKANTSSVYVAPSGCIGTAPDRKYYYAVDTSGHQAQGTAAVC